MGDFFVYILKSSVCLAVFYLFYRLLLSRETFHRFNRVSLLGVIILSVVIPFIRIVTEEPVVIQRPLQNLEYLLQMAEMQADVQVPTGQSVWLSLLLAVYLGGCIFFFVRFLYSTIRIFNLIGMGEKQVLPGGCKLVVTDKTVCPFSWMGYIVISRKDMEESGEEILTHELAHIHARHSIDMLACTFCVILQWFNPAVWLLKQELQNIHEYEADESVINHGVDAKKYQLLLIKKAVGSQRFTSMANSFNHSKLKKRITMMLKEKSNSWARLKLVLLVPVAACSMLAFARPDVNRELTNLMQSEDTTISPVGQPYTREFFDKEIDRYIGQAGGGQLSGSERLVFMEKHTRRVNFFINAKDQILYNSRFAGISEMPVKLKATLSASAGEKPVMIYFLCDVKTSDAAVKEALETVGKAFAEYQATAAGKNAPTLLFFGNPRKDYPLKGK